MIESASRKSNPVPWPWIGAAGAALALLVLAFFFDSPVDHWVAGHRNTVFYNTARFISRYFAWQWLIAVAGAALLVAWWRKRRELVRLLIVMMIAASVAGLSADFLRGLTGRTRPYVKTEQGFYGVRSNGEWLIIKHAYNSFPSGHTATITAFALPLLLWRRWLALLVIPLVLLVGSSRVYLAAHHVSDIIAGAMLGTVVAVWVWRRVKARA